MTTPDSTSSGAESTMDESSNAHHSHPTTPNCRRSADADQQLLDSSDTFTNPSDAEVWGNFTDNFRQVQSVLDRNRQLIEQVNENHRSKIHENMVKNIALIQEINGNISKVVSLYSDLSINFSSVFHQRSREADENDRIGEANLKN